MAKSLPPQTMLKETVRTLSFYGQLPIGSLQYVLTEKFPLVLTDSRTRSVRRLVDTLEKMMYVKIGKSEHNEPLVMPIFKFRWYDPGQPWDTVLDAYDRKNWEEDDLKDNFGQVIAIPLPDEKTIIPPMLNGYATSAIYLRYKEFQQEEGDRLNAEGSARKDEKEQRLKQLIEDGIVDKNGNLIL
ncbi:MAG: hypothetical protein M1129_04090 [Candidatus Thermoplasmatota archaeon]|nr:hypothetical protein [Candidatus Thermoplasmatota archaeon]MCL5955029.1 hypothetical protein [Candidatus Thermoplasmatota archaeon]